MRRAELACVYKSVDEQTERINTTMFHLSTICVVDSQKQDGGVDCGVFAIATATSLAMRGVHLATFDQSCSSEKGLAGLFYATCRCVDNISTHVDTSIMNRHYNHLSSSLNTYWYSKIFIIITCI